MAKESKSRLIASLLAFFFGTLGVHNFYLGFNGKAIAQLLITLLLGWVGIGLIITGIWSFIEFILIVSGVINKDTAGAPVKW